MTMRSTITFYFTLLTVKTARVHWHYNLCTWSQATMKQNAAMKTTDAEEWKFVIKCF